MSRRRREDRIPGLESQTTTPLSHTTLSLAYNDAIGIPLSHMTLSLVYVDAGNIPLSHTTLISVLSLVYSDATDPSL